MSIHTLSTKRKAETAVESLGTNRRLPAYTAIIGSAAFIIGAVLWALSGTDIDAAVTNGEMVNYLTTAAANKTVIVANLSSWIMGALLLGVAGSSMAHLSHKQGWVRAALLCYSTAVPLVIVSYVAMLAVVVQIAPDISETAVGLAKVIGWIGSRADWIATILIIGLGPLFLSQAGQNDWAPTWLVRLSYVAGFCGLLTFIALYTNALGTYGFIIIPVGLLWMIAAGVTLFRGNQ